MSVIPKIPRASGGALPPWAPYQGSTLDQLGTLSGPQNPRLLTPPNHKSWIRPWYIVLSIDTIVGADPGRPPPLKLGKNMIFWRKIVIFHTKYPKNVRGSLRNWKNYDFLA